MTHDERREEALRVLTGRVNNAPSRSRVQWRLGHRGAFLVTMGSIYLFLAWAYGASPLPEFTLQQLSGPIELGMLVGFDSQDSSMQAWGVLWAVSGLVAVLTAWYPPGRDGWGFAALWSFTALWSGLNMIGFIVYDAPRAYVLSGLFGLLALLVLIVSGMVDASPITRVADEQ